MTHKVTLILKPDHCHWGLHKVETIVVESSNNSLRAVVNDVYDLLNLDEFKKLNLILSKEVIL